MISGLERELQARMDGKIIESMRGNYPSPAVSIDKVALRRAKADIDKSNRTVKNSSTSFFFNRKASYVNSTFGKMKGYSFS